MVKQKLIGILIFLCMLVGLTSYRSNVEPVESSAGETTAAVQAEITPARSETAIIEGFGKGAEENLQLALSNCVGWGETAGSSLNTVVAASALMGWANDYSLKDSSDSAIDTMLKTCYNNMNSEEQQNFRANWQSISDAADQILTNYEGIADTVTDAGCEEAVDMIRTNEHSASNWAGLKTGFQKLLA